jgi:hypothetical protein
MSRISKNINADKFIEPLLISLFWVMLFAAPLMFGRFDNGIDWKHITNVWKDYFLLFALFLINRFILLPLLFFSDKRALYFICGISLILLIVGSRYVIYMKTSPRTRQVTVEQPVQPPPGPGSAPERRGDQSRTSRRPVENSSRPEPMPPYVNLLLLSVLVIGFDTGLKVTSKWSQSEQMRVKLEKENVENQLAFLRNQVSPHFFMNTLNNIHALIDYDSGEAKKSIIKLSNLMRHLLYDSDAELSPLKSEVEFIKSYVDLMKLRYSQKVKITLDLPVNLPEKSIPPLIFTSLLENAFKHGISYSHDSFIHIELFLLPDVLNFRIENSKIPPENDIMTPGIGIENTRKRLDLLFGDSYSLEITDKGNVFITNLRIPV